MEDSDLLATALFTRGSTCLEWGEFGALVAGVFQIQSDKLNAAIRDFQEALHLFPSREGAESMHPQLFGCLTVYLSRAQAALAVSKGTRVSPSIILALDDVADTVGRQNINDLYVRALITGTRKGWHQGGYLNTRAAVFCTAGMPGQALKELNTLDGLLESTYRKDETRVFAWLDLLKANVYMGLGEFSTATHYTKQALLACQDINSVTNIAIIQDIYGRLLASSHRLSADVQEIGDLLRAAPANGNPQS